MTATRSTRFIAILAVPALAALAAAPALAQDKGDQYEVTAKMEMKGMPMAMPPQTTKVCIAKNARDESFVPMKGNECKVTNSKKTGNTLSYRFECTGKDPMVGEGEVTYATDSYSGKMHLMGSSGGQPLDMTQTYSGKKVGECANPR